MKRRLNKFYRPELLVLEDRDMPGNMLLSAIFAGEIANEPRQISMVSPPPFEIDDTPV